MADFLILTMPDREIVSLSLREGVDFLDEPWPEFGAFYVLETGPSREAICTCGHRADQHQTGEGAWTGFCSGTLGQLGAEYLYAGADPNEPCECEAFTWQEG